MNKELIKIGNTAYINDSNSELLRETIYTDKTIEICQKENEKEILEKEIKKIKNVILEDKKNIPPIIPLYGLTMILIALTSLVVRKAFDIDLFASITLFGFTYTTVEYIKDKKKTNKKIDNEKQKLSYLKNKLEEVNELLKKLELSQKPIETNGKILFEENRKNIENNNVIELKTEIKEYYNYLEENLEKNNKVKSRIKRK